jgi:hypothetical protein
MAGFKHLIDCHCVLRIFKKNDKLINHKFPVYSKIDKDGKILPKLVKCNNCESLHWVYDTCKSELRGGKDQTGVTLSREDISLMLPERLVNILFKQNCDMSIWDQIADIYDESRWGEYAVIKRDIIDEEQQVKLLYILGENKFKIENKCINSTIYNR